MQTLVIKRVAVSALAAVSVVVTGVGAPVLSAHASNDDHTPPVVWDHREPEPPPIVRDHREPEPPPIVRDHREPEPPPIVRDHREPRPRPVVRDHRDD